ncbi:protein kinase domain-containing protein [Streptomyces adustus]
MSTHIGPLQTGDATRIGRYRVIGRLGSGGMGVVYAALDPEGQRVAVKVIHTSYAGNEEFRSRFRREVELSRRVTGPCLVPLLDADPDAATPWLATQYTPGSPLDRHISAHGPVTGARLYALAAGTAAGLAAVHQAGVVHRDVKPANVILTDAGPRVLDFGIAHALEGTAVTRTGVMTGTPGWISPEQYRTGAGGTPADVFAWGALVAYAATGRLPFGVGAADVVAFRVLSEDPDLDGMPADLRLLAEQALAKDPQDRPAAVGLAAQCTELLASQDTQVPVSSAGHQATLVADLVASHWDMPTAEDPAWTTAQQRHSRRRLAVTVAAGMGVFALVCGGTYTVLNPRFSPASAKGTTTPTTNSAGTSATPRSAPQTATPIVLPPVTDTASPSQQSTDTPTPTAVRPAYTVADTSQPIIDDWFAARDAETEAEQAVDREITSRTERELGQWGPEANVYVTFNDSNQTVYVASNFASDWTESDVASFTRTATAHACNVLAQRLKDEPATWPYGRFTVVWPKSDDEAYIESFGEATSPQACTI